MMMCLFALNRRPSITAESCDFGLIAAASCAAVPVATTETKIAAAKRPGVLVCMCRT